MAGVPHVEQVQPQGVGHHTEAAQAHRRRAEHGVQGQAEGDEQTGSQGNPHAVVEESPEQVLVDVPQCGPAHADGGGHIGKAALHQHHVRRVDGHVGARADGDADIRPGQGRGIVDAVAHHGHLSLLLQLADDALLAVREHTGDDLVHAGLGADGLGGALVVSGEHDHSDAHVPHLPDSLGAVLLDDIGHGDNAHQLLVLAEEQGRLTLLRQLLRLGLDGGGDLRLGLDELQVAGGELGAVELGGDAVAGQSLELGDLVGLHVPLLAFLHNGPGQGVLTLLLQGQGQAEELLLTDAGGGQNICYLGLAAGDGAGLVQGNNVHFPGLLQGGGGFEQDAVLGAHAVAHHDSHRSRQTQGAGTADDQHGDAPGQGVAKGLAQQQPHHRGDYGDGDNGRNKHAGDLVGHLGDGRLGRGGVGDHLNDLGQGGVLSHPGGLALDKAGLVQGSGRDRVPRAFVHRNALACESGLIHRAVALQDHAVHWDVLAGADHKNVALLDLINGNLRLDAVPNHSGGLGSQLHQTLEGVSGSALGPGLQHLAHSDEGQDHGCRLKVELAVHNMHLGHPRLHRGHLEQGVAAPHEGGGGAQGHQGIHVGGAVPQAFKAGDKKLLVDHHDDHSQIELDQCLSHIVLRQEGRQGPVPHHGAHGEIHQHRQKTNRPDQPLLQDRCLFILQGLLRLRHAAGGSLLTAGALLRGTVACRLHRRDNIRGGGGSLNTHGVGQQAHRAGCDARHMGHGFLHSGTASRAAHASDIVLLHFKSFYLPMLVSR